MNNNNTLNKREYIILAIIIIIAFRLRLYNINNPLADWHSWRQADTSAVTRRYVNEGINLFYPRYDDLSSIPSGLDNPQGWRFVEFPIINATTALFYNNIPRFSIEVWGRLTSILFSLGAIILVYKITSIFFEKRIGYFATAAFAFLPFNLYYHRTILPEVPMIFFALLAFLFFLKWLNSDKIQYFLISISAAIIGLLIKPFVLFFALPMFYFAYKKWKLSLFKQKSLYLYLILSITPFIIWRFWSSQFPEGIPAYTWLLNGSGIRFRPAFFRWIFAERFGKLILGYWGLIPFGIGLITKPNKKSGWIFHWWLAAMLVYLFTFATGNVTHDYYQIFIIPPIVIFWALGVDFLLRVPKQIVSQKLAYLLLIVSTIFGLGFSWFHIRDFYNINHPEIVAAGDLANVVLAEDAKVIAPYSGDTAFLYQTKRQGWPIGGDIKDKISKGATDYVTVNQDEEARYLIQRCKPTITIDEVTIISLKNCSL